MNFWGTAIGRSGTVWLSSLLNQSASHTVKHEDAEGMGCLPPDAGWKPFPIERWQDRSYYGEFHGLLIRYLSPDYAGLEKLIPRRFIVLRNPNDLITSWMNRDDHTLADRDWITREVIRRFSFLCAYAETDKNCRVFRFEDLITSVSELQNLVDWLECDLSVSPEDMQPKNQTVKQWFTMEEFPDLQNRFARHCTLKAANRIADFYPNV